MWLSERCPWHRLKEYVFSDVKRYRTLAVPNKAGDNAVSILDSSKIPLRKVGTEWEFCWMREALTHLLSWGLCTPLAPFSHTAEPGHLLDYSPGIRNGHKTTLAHFSFATRLVTLKINFPWVFGSEPSDWTEVHSASIMEARTNKPNLGEERTRQPWEPQEQDGDPLPLKTLPFSLSLLLSAGFNQDVETLVNESSPEKKQFLSLRADLKMSREVPLTEHTGSSTLSYELDCLSQLGQL